MRKHKCLNWCGAVVRNEDVFAGKMFSSVQATWTVPILTERPDPGETSYLASWIALGGGEDKGGRRTPPPQSTYLAGIAQRMKADKHGRANEHCYPFYLFDRTGRTSKYRRDSGLSFRVSPGDKITVKLDLATGTVTFLNHAINEEPFTASGFAADPGFTANTIEWIIERAAITRKKHEKLARFRDRIEFLDASGLTADGEVVSPHHGYALDMVEYTTEHQYDFVLTATTGQNLVTIEGPGTSP